MTTIKHTLMFAIVAIIFSINAFAQVKMGVRAGLAIPNDELTNKYQRLRDSSGKDYGQSILNEAVGGYYVGGSVFIDLGKDFTLIGNAGFNRFREQEIAVNDPLNQDKKLATLFVTRNIIPIEAQIRYMPIQVSILGIYGIAGVSYCKISESTDIAYEGNTAGLSIPVQTSIGNDRIGINYGLGLEIDLGAVKPIIEFKANIANLLGRDDGEEIKNFYNLTIGVIL